MKNELLRKFAILKWIPRLLMVGIILFSLYVYLRYGKTDNEPVPQPGIQRTERRPGGGKDRTPVQQMKKIEYSHFDKGRLVYHVTADDTRTMKSKQQQLDNPEFIFYDPDQNEIVRVTGAHCNISKDLSTITVYDNAVVTSLDGMTVESNQIRYNSDEQTFSTPSQSKFEYGTLKGNSKGFTYHFESEQLELHENPEVRYANKQSENKKPVVMVGERGFIDRRAGFAYFDGNVKVVQMKDTINAERIEASFKAGGNDLEKLTALQNVRVRFARPRGQEEEGSETVAAAPEPESTVPAGRQAPSMGNVFVAESSSGKDLDAEVVELYFYEDGATIRAFHSEGNCVLTIHTFDDKDRPSENRIINGETFDAVFNLAGEMEEFRAVDKVSVKLQPVGNQKRLEQAARQTIYCRELIASFHGNTGDVKDIHFTDEFKHVQEGRTVSSDKAVYSAALRKTDLIGNPEIDDPSFNITATDMEMFEETSGIHAKGNVKSQFVNSGDGKTETPHTFPFSSPSNQPVYISSEDMLWDSQKSEATYTVKAKLWQDKNVITAEKLIINDRLKTLSAYGKVHTIFYNNSKKEASAEKGDAKKQAQTAPAADPNEPTTPKMFDSGSEQSGPITVDAGVMNYSERDRIVHFEKDVKILTTGTTINSAKADFYLREKGSEFERLYAQGNVTIVSNQKRGSGDQAVFYANEKKLVLEGHPKLIEPGQADIVGQVLTLFLADDRILIDGQEDGRATTVLAVTKSPVPTSESSKKKEEN